MRAFFTFSLLSILTFAAAGCGGSDLATISGSVTYDGKPLYYYFDEGPGELRCHNVPGFGGLWLALDKSGNPV